MNAIKNFTQHLSIFRIRKMTGFLTCFSSIHFTSKATRNVYIPTKILKEEFSVLGFFSNWNDSVFEMKTSFKE